MDKTVEIRLKFGLDDDQADQAAAALKKIEQNAGAAEQKLNRLRESAERMTQVGMALAGVGAALGAPLILAMQAYITKTGEASRVSKEWLAAQKSIEASQLRIGQAVATELLPYLKDAAQLAGQVADFTERHPDAVKLALAVAATGVGVGGIVSAVAQAVMVGTALISVLSSAGIIGATATATGGAAVGLTAVGAAALGMVAPLAAAAAALVALGLTVNKFATDLGQETTDFQNTLLTSSKDFADYQAKVAALKAQLNTPIPPNAGLQDFIRRSVVQNLVNSLPLVSDATAYLRLKGQAAGEGVSTTPGYLNYGVGTGAINAPRNYGGGGFAETSAATNALAGLYRQRDAAARERLDAERRGAADLAQVDADYQAQRLDALKNFQADEARAEQDFLANRARAIKDFRQNSDRLEADYYTARAKAAQQHAAQTQADEADHQKAMQRLSEDNAGELDDLARSRDALGYAKALRRQETERQRAETDYQAQVAQRDQAWAEELAAQETQYQKEKTQREQDFMQRLLDEQAAYDAEKAQRQQALADANAAELAAYTEQRKKLQKQTTQTLTDLQLVFSKLQSEINALLPNRDALGPPRQRVEGGYADYGRYALGERGREFVLSADTTRQAEQSLGGALSQERVARGLGGGGLSIDIGGINIAGGDPAGLAREISAVFEQRLVAALRRARPERVQAVR